MSPLVLTRREKFRSLVQRCIFWVKKNMVFLSNAQPAHLSYRIPGGSLSYDIPLKCVGNALVFQSPDVGTKGSAIPASVSNVWIMTCV